MFQIIATCFLLVGFLVHMVVRHCSINYESIWFYLGATLVCYVSSIIFFLVFVLTEVAPHIHISFN